MAPGKLNAYFFLRTDHKNRDNTHTIYLRVVHGRRKKDVSTGLRTDKQWDAIRQQIKARDRLSRKINDVLDAYKRRIYDIIYNAEIKGEPLDIDRFLALFFNRGKTDFYDFAFSVIKTLDLAPETLRAYKAQITKLQQFAPKLYLEDIDLRFIMSYREYLLTERNNNLNTASKSLKFLRGMINHAIKQRIIESDPFEHIKISSYQGNREYLTKIELQALESYYQKTTVKSHKRVLQYFLFNCYVGLRYKDLKALRWDNIKKTKIDSETVEYIEIVMHKTKKIVTIPLLEKAKKYLPEAEIKLGRIFNVYTNQVTNRILKEIALAAGIHKVLTSHIARHTFATMAIEAGVPIETVSDLLGHTQIKTTQIYAKITLKKKILELKKL